MLRKVLLIAVLGVCYGSIFSHNFKLSSARKSIHSLAEDVQSVVDKQGSKLESAVDQLNGKQKEMLGKLTSSLLLGGQPLAGHRPEAVLPIFGVPKPSSPRRSEGSPVTVEDYKVVNCSAKSGAFVIRDLTVSPDPLNIPGDIKFMFDINLTEDLDNVMVAVAFYKKIGSGMVKIPCIGTFGSCTYNVCQMLQEVQTCPPELTQIGIDCQCPFKKGTYHETEIDAEIEAAVFPPGDYFATANIMAQEQFAGCYNVTFSVS